MYGVQTFRKTYDGSGMPIVKDAKENVFPDVTDCDADKLPVTSNLLLFISTIE